MRPTSFAHSAVHGSSAGNTRGLIEATFKSWSIPSRKSLPRGIPAASLKQLFDATNDELIGESSAGNTRGLIEAYVYEMFPEEYAFVFRGEYPRPH